MLNSSHFCTKFWGHNLEKMFRLFGLNIFAPWYLDDWVKWCEQRSISAGINGAPDILILNQCQAHILPPNGPCPAPDRHKCPIIDVRSEDICTRHQLSMAGAAAVEMGAGLCSKSLLHPLQAPTPSPTTSPNISLYRPRPL